MVIDTIVPCNLSLITSLVGDCRLFSDINVSQGSVATHMMCGGIFNKYFASNFLENLIVKKFENLLRINTLTAMSLVLFWNTVY